MPSRCAYGTLVDVCQQTETTISPDLVLLGSAERTAHQERPGRAEFWSDFSSKSDLVSVLRGPWPSDSAREKWLRICESLSTPAGAIEIGLAAWVEAACQVNGDGRSAN